MNVVLIGLRGTGKSTVAQLVAQRLGWPWFDADALIEARAGKSIAQIFADDGEPAFRDFESQVVADLAARVSAVLALGGGAIVREENRQALARQGRVVWLTASPETLWKRIQADQTTAGRRPNLSATGGINEIIATLDARREIYRQSAELEVDTEGKTPEQVADAIVEGLGIGG
ncbi:MAG: shikimate kinase [Planctomycetota bacterium]|nr:MAG: shikimate kinase [Planctomycetota bacterium]